MDANNPSTELLWSYGNKEFKTGELMTTSSTIIVEWRLKKNDGDVEGKEYFDAQCYGEETPLNNYKDK